MVGLCVLLFLFPQLLFFIMHMNGCSVFSAEKQTCLSQLQNRQLEVGGFLQTWHGHCIECGFLLANVLPRHGDLSRLAARQHADEWQGSECRVTGREQEPFTTSLVAPAVANRKEAHSGEAPAVWESPPTQKGFVQKGLCKRWTRQKELLSLSQAWTGKTGDTSQHPWALLLHPQPLIWAYPHASGATWGAAAHVPAPRTCSQRMSR